MLFDNAPKKREVLMTQYIGWIPQAKGIKFFPITFVRCDPVENGQPVENPREILIFIISRKQFLRME